MLLTTVLDFRHGERQAVILEKPEMSDAPFVIVKTEDRQWETDLQALAERLGPNLLVPEVWREVLPQAGLLISPFISGGDLRQRLAELPARRCWLTLTPMRMAFPLPCPDGQGAPVSDLPEKEGFYSESLCCRYIHEPGRVFLYDTEETLERKKSLAESMGFCGVIEGLG